MKLDLKRLADLLSQQEDNDSVSKEGVNDYLLNKILFPCVNGETVRLSDIDFDAFDVEDVDTLVDYYEALLHWVYELEELAKGLGGIRPAAVKRRAFC